jgi:large conductance mechanosensitive channel
MGMLKEYKEFISRGNVIDLAVGVVIGGAFGKIVSSLVSDIVMPPIGMLLSGVDFKQLKWVLQKAEADAAGVVTKAEVAINIGNFIQIAIEFLIIAWVIFLIVRAINSIKKNEPPPPPAEPTAQEKLLAEIRDALKK